MQQKNELDPTEDSHVRDEYKCLRLLSPIQSKIVIYVMNVWSCVTPEFDPTYDSNLRDEYKRLWLSSSIQIRIVIYVMNVRVFATTEFDPT